MGVMEMGTTRGPDSRVKIRITRRLALDLGGRGPSAVILIQKLVELKCV